MAITTHTTIPTDVFAAEKEAEIIEKMHHAPEGWFLVEAAIGKIALPILQSEHQYMYEREHKTVATIRRSPEDNPDHDEIRVGRRSLEQYYPMTFKFYDALTYCGGSISYLSQINVYKPGASIKAHRDDFLGRTSSSSVIFITEVVESGVFEIYPDEDGSESVTRRELKPGDLVGLLPTSTTNGKSGAIESRKHAASNPGPGIRIASLIFLSPHIRADTPEQV